MHVELADGRKLSKRVDYPRGNAKNPLKDSEVEGKFKFLAAPALGEEGAKKVLEHVWKIEGSTGVGELMGLVKMPA